MRVTIDAPEESPRGMLDHGKSRSFGKKALVPRNAAQRHYMEQIEHHDMMFGIGPAGTGKTYIAVAMAGSALLSKQVTRIILGRAAGGNGEKDGSFAGYFEGKS